MKKVLDSSMASHWTALGLFWKRSYWQRSWIMQELLAGKYLELQIQLRDLSLFLNEPYKWEEPGPLLGTLRSPQVLEVRPTKKIGGILEAVLTFRSTLARDPRDNIFSSLGIVNSDVNCVTDFPVDYSISWQALFHRFAVHVITSAHSAGSLRLLAPNWINTFDIEYDRALMKGYSSSEEIIFRPKLYAAGDTKSPARLFSADSNLLVVQGILVNRATKALCNEELSLEKDDSLRKTLCFLTSGSEDNGTIGVWLLELFYAVHCSANVDDVSSGWAVTGLLELCRRCLYSGNVDFSRCTWLQRMVLERGLLRSCTVFKIRHASCREATCKYVEQPTTTDQTPTTKNRHTKTKNGKSTTLTPSSEDENYFAELFGISRVETQVGDFVAVIIGCRIPLILREVEGTEHFQIVGPAYVSGIMHGEALEKLPEREIILC
ncbi:MAG: hypothetical protein MMC33_008625 [Icmadophila ericetorum]|nr:hypothetical protein [Icmadophila ericetorum]